MYSVEHAFYDLLSPVLDVPIVVKPVPIDYTPCITIFTADESFQKRRYIEIDHEQHILKKYNVDLWLNIYANSQKERYELVRQVNERILQAEANHYTTCGNYQHEDEKCKVLEDTCEALTRRTGRSMKHQCPNPSICKSFFKAHNISRPSFTVQGIINKDDYDKGEPVLRTIFKLNMDYIGLYNIGGILFEDIDIEELI